MINRTIRVLESRLGSERARLPVALLRLFSRALYGLLNLYGRFLLTPWNVRKHRGCSGRRLEIGPGPQRIQGFEALNIGWASNADYVADASRRLPFASGSFDLLYASHILEHVPWYRLSPALAEWVRVLAPGGVLEVWVPDGLKIARAFVEAEDGESSDFHQDGWYKFNDDKDPCLWMNGRTFSYGDGRGTRGDPNWHLTTFSPRFLRDLMAQAGLEDIEPLDLSEVRGNDHGWINLGFRGRKPG